MSEQRIELTPCHEHLKVWLDDTLLAVTDSAITLHEAGYPARLYIPREDVRMALLEPSETVTHCPYKGQACYFHYGAEKDIAWCYPTPLETMSPIADALCFTDRCRVEKG